MVEIGIVNSNSNRKTNADKIDKAIRPQDKIKYFSLFTCFQNLNFVNLR
jgi:hypothetical protein